MKRRIFKAVSVLLTAVILLIGCQLLQNPIAVTGLALDKDSVTLQKGKTANLSAQVVPSDAENPEVRWISTNETVALVDDNGTVTAVSEGAAVVIASSKDGGFQADCSVIVTKNADGPIAVEGIDITESEVSVKKGTELKLTVVINPGNADNTLVIWKSSNENIASVSADGSITGLAAGRTTVSVATKDGGYSDSCIFIVTPDKLVLFYSNNTYGGNLGGRIGVDDKIAKDPGRPSDLITVHAFISVNSVDCMKDMPANFRFPPDVPVVARNGEVEVVLAENWTQMFGEGGGPCSYYLKGAPEAAGFPYENWWTGSYSTGKSRDPGSTCYGWTTELDGVYGYFGNCRDRDMYYFYGNNQYSGTSRHRLLGIGY